MDDKNHPVKTDIIWVYNLKDKTFMRIIPSDDLGTFSFTLPGDATDVAFEINTPGYKTGAIDIPPDKNEGICKYHSSHRNRHW